MYREVSVIEVRELLRVWMAGAGLRRVAVLPGLDRKTARDYTNAAELAGLDRNGDLDQLTDELIGAVIAAVRPVRPDGHGATWELLRANHDQIVEWVGKDFSAHRQCGSFGEGVAEVVGSGSAAVRVWLPALITMAR